MKIYRVWRGEQNMGLYVANNEREAVAEAANDEGGDGSTVGMYADRWQSAVQNVKVLDA